MSDSDTEMVDWRDLSCWGLKGIGVALARAKAKVETRIDVAVALVVRMMTKGRARW